MFPFIPKHKPNNFAILHCHYRSIQMERRCYSTINPNLDPILYHLTTSIPKFFVTTPDTSKLYHTNFTFKIHSYTLCQSLNKYNILLTCFHHSLHLTFVDFPIEIIRVHQFPLKSSENTGMSGRFVGDSGDGDRTKTGSTVTTTDDRKIEIRWAVKAKDRLTLSHDYEGVFWYYVIGGLLIKQEMVVTYPCDFGAFRIAKISI